MAFNPKAVAAMKIREAQNGGMAPSNPMSPQNIQNAVSLAPTNPIPNPLSSATTSPFKPHIPGLPVPKIGTFGALRKFAKLRTKLSGE